jgi:hypothetical protein
MSQSNLIEPPIVPQPNPPPGPLSSLPENRDLAAEKLNEMKLDANAASAKASRFTVKKNIIPSRPTRSGPEYESLILKAAANCPFADLTYPKRSTFVPNAATMFAMLQEMDLIMSGTKRWIDNSLGWAPPISQMYISVLFYYQIFRAIKGSGSLTHDQLLFVMNFETTFPLSELWIPGPLVAGFRALSSFQPDTTEFIGPVTVYVPTTPGWSLNSQFRMNAHTERILPNVSFFLSRLHDISTLATSAETDAGWATHTNGLSYCESINGLALSNDAASTMIMSAPGMKTVVPGDRQLWRNCAARLTSIGIPDRLNQLSDPENTWTAFLFMSSEDQYWFGSVSAIMAKYCQFFHGSVPVSEMNATSNPTGAVKQSFAANSSLHDAPVFNAHAGNNNDHHHGSANAVAHYTLSNARRIITDATVAIRDLPDAFIYTALTYNLNCYPTANLTIANRIGVFWTIVPDTKSRNNNEVFPGTLSTITREYHSDVRIPADRQ